MSEITGAKFTCPSCGKQYKWKPELAGKKGKCKCGGVLAIPAKPPAEPAPEPAPVLAPETDPFGDSYDVADQPVQQAPAYSNAPTTISAAPAAAARRAQLLPPALRTQAGGNFTSFPR